MRVSSYLLLLSCIIAISGIAVIGYALVEDNHSLLILSLGILALFLSTILGYRYYASSSRCPLCLGPVLLSRQCSRSNKAQKSFGSYRLRVARDIVLKNSFTCPYCGEPTKCEVKKATQPVSTENSTESTSIADS